MEVPYYLIFMGVKLCVYTWRKQ